MHRIDLAVASGVPLDVDEEHDGRLVADLVAEWATTHPDPFTLHLTGLAGSILTRGRGSDDVMIDAVDFARTLAGRLPGHGVLAHPFPCEPAPVNLPRPRDRVVALLAPPPTGGMLTE